MGELKPATRPPVKMVNGKAREVQYECSCGNYAQWQCMDVHGLTIITSCICLDRRAQPVSSLETLLSHY